MKKSSILFLLLVWISIAHISGLHFGAQRIFHTIGYKHKIDFPVIGAFYIPLMFRDRE